MAQPPKQTPPARPSEDTKVQMPGRPPAVNPVDDDDEVFSDLTKAEQEAGKETLKAFGEQTKAEQQLGAKLLEQYARGERATKGPRTPPALPKPAGEPPKHNPLHGNPRG